MGKGRGFPWVAHGDLLSTGTVCTCSQKDPGDMGISDSFGDSGIGPPPGGKLVSLGPKGRLLRWAQ